MGCADPGPVAEQEGPDSGRRRWLLPRPDHRAFRAGTGLLGRQPRHRSDPRRDQARPQARMERREQRRRRPAEHADVVEDTGILDLTRWTKTCPGMCVIVRREHPHPGATLDAFEIRDGHRYQAFTTNTGRGQLAFLEARHRAHARVEDRIRTGKDTGLGHLPSLILSRPVDHGCDLVVCVVDGVVDVSWAGRWSARSDEFRALVVGRVATASGAEDRGCALFAEGLGQPVA